MRKYKKTAENGTIKLFPLRLFMNLCARILLCVVALASSGRLWAEEPAADDDYQLGHGWKIPGTAIRLGGYASLEAEKDRHEPFKINASDVSLFVWWEGEGKLRFFSELDLEDALVYEDGQHPTTRHGYLALERAYADYLYSERLNFRAGKFLTPIGRWNVIHAEPLVWTSTRPLVTERAFPTNATGVMAYGTLPVGDREIDYSVYSAVGEDWRPNPKLDPFEEAYGMHVTVPVSPNAEVGVSYANFRQRASNAERKNLLGMDYFWTHERYEVSAELAYRLSDEGSTSDEVGLFIQGVAPLTDRLYAIGRYEWYNPAGPAAAMNIGLLGLAFKLSPAMILKAEYIHASHNTVKEPEGVFTSFAILF
jgi:hypothetical protein